MYLYLYSHVHDRIAKELVKNNKNNDLNKEIAKNDKFENQKYINKIKENPNNWEGKSITYDKYINYCNL